MNRTNSNKQAPATNNAGASKSSPGVQLGTRNQPTNRLAAGQAPVGKSRLTSQTLAGGNTSQQRHQQQQQQQPFQQKIITAPMPIINAPTSLTNLAQLSGITLLPIANTSRLQPNTATISPMPRASSSIVNSNTPHHHQYQQQQPRQKPAGSQSKQTNVATYSPFETTNQQHYDQQKFININSQQPVYNLATVPSFQLLNQASSNNISSESMTNSWVSTTIRNEPIQIQTQSKPTNFWPNNRRTKFQSNPTTNQLLPPSSNNDIQVIPVTDGLPIFDDLSDLQPSQSTNNFDDILSQPSIESIEESCVDVNGDLNNISLMKLMAILNNPALTITAVGSNKNPIRLNHRLSPSMEDHIQQPSQAPLNFIDNRQISITMPNKTGTSYNQFENNYIHEACSKDQRMESQPRTRVPQSAANLQMIHKVNVNPISPYSKRNQPPASSSRNPIINNSKDQSSTLPQNDHKQLDLQLNWLPSYNTNCAANATYQTITAQWPSGPSFRKNEREENDKTNDPTLLSTSVRNLMMQQLPSSTKNSTASVHLLKHIADQTKDNDCTSNQTQTHKSSIELECILSSSKSLPQVVSNKAKRIESLKTVRSLDIPEKLHKRPLQTSENRLYIPRSDCLPSKRKKAVSEPKFNLNEIIIDEGGSREVFISEQHQMLDSMVSNGTRKQRRSAMPEPDEIFINRSKRVMSLIDTMIERKKRRRFERISGRAEPKTNSLEDQCAESEEEWSSDETLDYTGFIKTQLPLEEIETEEKRNHLQCLGLVSRREKNKLLLEQCEEKMKIFSPLATQESREVSQDLERFYNTILKTGGTDVQLRIESDIKRNDLPLIEGLNRNTSRMKMCYMNCLGLEKRSKRTTLYKVKPLENFNTNVPKLIDLNKIKAANVEKEKVEPTETPRLIVSARPNERSGVLPFKLNFNSCRKAMKPPSKNEYMKSLGLMAS